MDTKDITGLVLAGGRGTRMGTVDKGLQVFRGAPMALHVIMRLQPQVGALMINANQNLGPWEAFGLPVCPDEIGGFAGPLAGLHTGLSHCETGFIATAPCDSPFLPANLVQQLAAGLEAQEADLAVAVTVEGERRQPHPVFCLARTSLLPHLDAFLRQGGRKVDAWYASLKVAEVVFPDADAFRNINSLEELRRYEAE